MASDKTNFSKGLPRGTWKNLFYPPEKDEYTYFAYAKTSPFLASGVSQEKRYLVKAALAADAAMLSYAHYGERKMPDDDVSAILKDAGLPNFAKIGNWDSSGTQGYFAWNDDFALLAFRGTERNDLQDSAADSQTWPSLESDVASTPGVEQHSPSIHRLIQSLKGAFDANSCWVHTGFQRALDQVWNQVIQLLDGYRHTHPNAEICFTGHSLGAALATLAVSRFTGGNASLFTFGSPRTGNAVFCERVTQRADRGIYRFVNGGDLVTHVPIEAPIFRHVESLCYLIAPDGGLSRCEYKALADCGELAVLLRDLPTHGAVFDLNGTPPSELVDHSPARYCLQLRKGLTGMCGQ